MTTETKSKRSGFVPNIISGLATGLFSIPEGMAYAQLAGANPIYGMYSGIVATIVASLSTGTILSADCRHCDCQCVQYPDRVGEQHRHNSQRTAHVHAAEL